MRLKADFALSVREVDGDSNNIKMLRHECMEHEQDGVKHSFWVCTHHSLNKVVQTVATTAGRGVFDGLTSFCKWIRSGQSFWSRICLAVRVVVRRNLRVYFSAAPAGSADERYVVANFPRLVCVFSVLGDVNFL